MKLIVGLGNPGPQYRGTRHNIGFAVLDELARRAEVAFDAAPVEALMARWRDRETLLAKPSTFMNASGEAVGALLRYFKVEVVDLLVIVDEVQLPLAKLRARARGSAGGHNGLKSIITYLGDDFAGCAWASGAATRGATWPITCSRSSTKMRPTTSIA